MYSALDIARYIIWYCEEKQYIVSNLKLQRILYFIQAKFLVEKNTPCFSEKIEAWTFGPVIPEVYQQYKIFGNAHIPCVDVQDDFKISEQDKALIDNMIDKCSKFTASQLVEITHRQTPWKKAYRSYQNNEITQLSIKEFFRNG